MKHLKTVMLAGALAFATTTVFAQIGVGAGGKTSGGASIGAGSGGAGSSGGLNAGASGGADIGGSKAGVDVDAQGNSNLKMKKNQTTGSGAVGGNVKGTIDVK